MWKICGHIAHFDCRSFPIAGQFGIFRQEILIWSFYCILKLWVHTTLAILWVLIYDVWSGLLLTNPKRFEISAQYLSCYSIDLPSRNKLNMEQILMLIKFINIYSNAIDTWHFTNSLEPFTDIICKFTVCDFNDNNHNNSFRLFTVYFSLLWAML